VAAEFVRRRMNRSRCRRVVLLLDCFCFAGALERGMVALAGVEVGIDDHVIPSGRRRPAYQAASRLLRRENAKGEQFVGRG
jgi:hypothetical protein